jgi:hypothetical protein
MESCLTDTIEGRYGGLEKRVTAVKQRNEEHIISLEMARSEEESDRADIERRVDDLKLEVCCLNRFLKRETLEHNLDKSGIFGSKESTPGAPHAGSTTNGPDGHRSAPHTRDVVFGSNVPHPQIPANGTFPHQSHDVDPLHGASSACRDNSYNDAVHASHGQLPKLNFPVFNGDDPNSRGLDVRVTFRCMVFKPPCG